MFGADAVQGAGPATERARNGRGRGAFGEQAAQPRKGRWREGEIAGARRARKLVHRVLVGMGYGVDQPE
jgi:hypothetical protein